MDPKFRVGLPALALALALTACAGAAAGGAAQPAVPTPTAGPDQPQAAPSPARGSTDAAPAPTGHASSGELSIDGAVALVRADLAGRLGVSPSAIKLVSAEPRTWPDAGLGCMARRGQIGGPRVPGYLIVLGHGDRQYTYHTDRAGAFVLCQRPAKPIDPIR